MSKFDWAGFLIFVLVSRDLELAGVPAVSPSRKKRFSDFNDIWYVDTGRCRMTRFKVKVKVTSN